MAKTGPGVGAEMAFGVTAGGRARRTLRCCGTEVLPATSVCVPLNAYSPSPAVFRRFAVAVVPVWFTFGPISDHENFAPVSPASWYVTTAFELTESEFAGPLTLGAGGAVVSRVNTTSAYGPPPAGNGGSVPGQKPGTAPSSL